MSDLNLCDCCKGLHDEVFDAGGHMQCRTCTENAHLTAENERAWELMESIFGVPRKYGKRLDKALMILEGRLNKEAQANAAENERAYRRESDE